MSDVVRTPIYVTDISEWERIGRAHGEVFKEIRPAISMLGGRVSFRPTCWWKSKRMPTSGKNNLCPRRCKLSAV